MKIQHLREQSKQPKLLILLAATTKRKMLEKTLCVWLYQSKTDPGGVFTPFEQNISQIVLSARVKITQYLKPPPTVVVICTVTTLEQCGKLNFQTIST